jgi:branched-subunit amino acid transport protein
MSITALTFGMVIIGMGIVTFAIRLLPIVLVRRLAIRPTIQRALRFVPPAVLSAIVFPEVLHPGGTFDVSLSNARLLAALVAAVLVWRTRNVFVAIAAGMLALWLFQATLSN